MRAIHYEQTLLDEIKIIHFKCEVNDNFLYKEGTVHQGTKLTCSIKFLEDFWGLKDYKVVIDWWN